MRYRILDANGDMTFGSGQNNFYVNVPAAVGQACMTRLLLWLGEWFLDTSVGVDYPGGVLGRKPKVQADSTLQDTIVNTQGLVDFENYVSVIDDDTRGFTLSCDIDTIYGPTQLQISNYVNY